MNADFIIRTYDRNIQVSGCEVAWSVFKKAIRVYGYNRVFMIDENTGEVVADSQEFPRG